MMEKKRSVGVTVFAYLHKISRVLGLIFSAIIIIMKKRPKGLIIYAVSGFILGAFCFDAYILFEFGLFMILLSLGLFLLWDWVRKFIVISSWIFLLVYLWFIVSMFLNPDPQGGIFVALTLPILLLSIYAVVYFTRPKVKEQFKKKEIPNA